MTTIVYRDGVLAGDTRVTVGDMVVTNRKTKVHRLKDGRLFGWCGGVEHAEVLLRALRKNKALPEGNACDALLVTPDGTLWLRENVIWIKQKEPYYALGSGSPYAWGALDAGATAVEAVEIGINRDTNSGGRVKFVALES